MANTLIRSATRNAVVAAFTTGCLLGASGVQAADSTMNSNTLPTADAGECYAKVNVPAVYKTETLSTIVRQASQTITITPAKFQDAIERVLIKEASTELIPVEPVYEEKEDRVMLSAASRGWVRSSLESDIPASAGMLADLAESGVKVDGATPGQCFYEFHKPASYKEVEDKVLVAEATEKLDVRAAQFSKSDQQVMVKASAKRLKVVPTVFETVTEKVMVEAAHREWKKGRGPIERIDNSTGEIMCLISVPARFEEVETKVVKTAALTRSSRVPAEFDTITVERLTEDSTESRIAVPAKYESITRRNKVADAKLTWIATEKTSSDVNGKATGNVVCFKETPAKYKTYKRKVVKTPGSYESIKVPAEYKTVKVQKLASNATEKRIPVPEKKAELLKRSKVSDARLEWRPVLCETNMTTNVVIKIQRALNVKGYPAGKVDGVLGSGTLRALEKFQADKNLAQGGLTYTTIEALGVKL